MLKCHRCIFKFWYSRFLTSDKLRLSITEEYKQQSCCAFTWCVRNIVESWKREVQKEATVGTAAWCWKLIWNPCLTPTLPTPIPWQHCTTEKSDASGTVLLKINYFPVGLAFNRISPWSGWPQWRIWEFSSGSRRGGGVCSFQWHQP